MDLDVARLERSFDRVAGRGPELVDLCYARLLELAPGARTLFGGIDASRQRALLLEMLVTLRGSLRDLTPVVPRLHDLGALLADRGVDPAHYALVGRALLDAMAAITGPEWSPADGAAWADAYEVVEQAMLDGAAHPTA